MIIVQRVNVLHLAARIHHQFQWQLLVVRTPVLRCFVLVGRIVLVASCARFCWVVCSPTHRRWWWCVVVVFCWGDASECDFFVCACAMGECKMKWESVAYLVMSFGVVVVVVASTLLWVS